MATGPILARELLTAARRPQTYRQRCALAALLLLVIGGVYVAVQFWDRGQLSIREMAALTYSTFISVVLLQGVLTFWLVPTFVAGVIADERERRTLGELLTTRLTSAEIVLGKLAARLVQYATWLATGLPVVALLPLLGGVDPGLVLLAYAGTASTAFFLAGLSVLVSTGARRGGEAVRGTLALASVWLILPFAVIFLVLRLAPGLRPWAEPVFRWLLASTPTGLFLDAKFLGRGWTLFGSVFRMIGLQLAGGSLMIAWAVARLRSASRSQAGGDPRGLARLRQRPRRRLVRRPACGDEPMLWKEIHTGRPGGVAGFAGVLAFLMIFAAIGYGVYSFGRPAVLEWFAHGIGPATADVSRLRFNLFLRGITSVVGLVALLAVAGAAAEGVAAERAQGTWDCLLATPLGGRQILRAKLLGAAWKARWGFALLAALWAAGLLAGALHPLGVAAALLVVGVSAWFGSALGTYASLVSRDTTQATTRATAPLVLLTGTFLACYLPTRVASVLLGAGSLPFVHWLFLVSYRDVHEALEQGTFSHLSSLAIFTEEGPLRVLATCLIGTAAYAAGAAWLTHAAFVRFDHFAGRPERAPAAGDVRDPRGRRGGVRQHVDEGLGAVQVG